MSSGKQIYSVLGKFTEGGMATLTSVVLEDGKRALLRELHTAKILSLTQHCNFRRGTQIRSQLSPHPNIVNSLEQGYHGFRPYEIIEWVDGQNLKALANSQSEILKKELTYIVMEAAEALAWVHQNGLLHLDVKPENFLLRETNGKPQVKLTDFDLSRERDSDGVKMSCGTPGYMAPEQSHEGKAYPATDVFAFSMMVYRLLTGRNAFAGENVKQLRRHQFSYEVQARPPQEYVPWLKPSTCSILMKGLAKRHDDRYYDMMSMVSDMKRKNFDLNED